MKYSLHPALVSTLALTLALPALAAPINQSMLLPNGTSHLGSNNHTKMAKGGRYVPFTSISPLYIRDIKTQITTPSPISTGDSNFFAISPSGRYVAFHRNKTTPTPPNDIYDTVILDRGALPTPTEITINAQEGANIGLSDNGYAFFNRINGTDKQLVRYNIKTQQEELVTETNASLGQSTQPHPLSSDGKIGLFSVGSTYKIYNAVTKQVTTLNPLTVEGWGVTIPSSSASITLSSNGKFVAFYNADGGPPGDRNALYVLNLESPTQTAVRYPITPKGVVISGGLSASRDARFISFAGRFGMGYPDWAAANAIAPSMDGRYPAVFRYDTVTNQLVTMSTSNTGGPLENKNDPCCTPLQPLVNNTSVLSDDGSMVQFATSSPTVSSVFNSAAEANFHAYLSNGFARNYQFVDMPNSDIGYRSFAGMTLVGNNQWEGTLSFDGVGTEGFKFDAGGVLVNGKFTAVADFGINFGAGSTAGQSVSGGGNIPVTGGAGDYTVTFNDQTLKYTVTKQNANADWKRTVVMVFGQTQTGQDMFIRGGLDHQKALANIGINCDANPSLCSMPIRHINKLNPTTAPWKQGDTKLDWQGIEVGQGSGSEGSPLDWTTDIWPSSWGATKTVALNGYGVTPLNLWGQHYWLLDVEMDCSKTHNGWFELKSFISNGPGWEGNITQAGAPWASNNHFAQCGKMNVFKRGQSAPVVVGGAL